MTGVKSSVIKMVFAAAVAVSGVAQAQNNAASLGSLTLRMPSDKPTHEGWTSTVGETTVAVYRRDGKEGHNLSVVRANATGQGIPVTLDRDVLHIDCKKPLAGQVTPMYRSSAEAGLVDTIVHNRAVNGAEILVERACKAINFAL